MCVIKIQLQGRVSTYLDNPHTPESVAEARPVSELGPPPHPRHHRRPRTTRGHTAKSNSKSLSLSLLSRLRRDGSALGGGGVFGGGGLSFHSDPGRPSPTWSPARIGTRPDRILPNTPEAPTPPTPGVESSLDPRDVHSPASSGLRTSFGLF